MAKPDGGPAFPPSTLSEPYRGMSLRDYFAAKIVQVLFVGDDNEVFETVAANHGKTATEMIVFEAYRIADAMLAEREK